MPGDSISTFLDITATAAKPQPEPEAKPEVTRRAEALAKIADGVTSLERLAAETDLSHESAKEAVEWLSDNGLVEVQAVDRGSTKLGLTSTAENALE
jgi:hypothetical protein